MADDSYENSFSDIPNEYSKKIVPKKVLKKVGCIAKDDATTRFHNCSRRTIGHLHPTELSLLTESPAEQGEGDNGTERRLRTTHGSKRKK